MSAGARDAPAAGPVPPKPAIRDPGIKPAKKAL